VVVQARRRGGWDSNSSSRSRRNSQDDDRSFRFKFNQVDVALAEDQLWKLALPFAALFGLAVFIGEWCCEVLYQAHQQQAQQNVVCSEPPAGGLSSNAFS
jgi:hypothetical protein